ncbi:MAG: carboxypeptidase regulatory-like domain-containing protein [Bacteroidota bacterium]
MKKLIIILLFSYFIITPFLLFVGGMGSCFAQDGSIKGRVADKASGESIPFANIIAESGGKMFGGATTDFDGYYTIKPLPPRKYDVKITYVGYKSIVMSGVIVSPDRITFQDFKMQSTVEELGVVEVFDYKVPLISKDKTQSGESVTREDIGKMAARSATGIAATVGGVFQKERSSDLNIRGARGESSNVYIDGVKVRGSSGIPQSAIDQVTVVTGGLPAKYGDATGGIISITTRGPSAKYYGGVDFLSSGFYIKNTNIGLDPYAYNLLGFNVSGPLLMMFDKTDSTKKPLLGFFLAGDFSSVKDGSPSSIQMYKVKDDVLDYLKETPLSPSGTGSGSYQNAEFITKDDLEEIKIRQNVTSKGLVLSAKVDVRTGPNINLSFGGNMDFNTYRDYSYENSLFNYENNGQVINNTWRVYGKFTQKFDSGEREEDKSTTIKNAYYTLHVDYTKFHQTVQDAKHKDNFFDYGYIGKFTTHSINSYGYGIDSVTGLAGYLHNAWQDTLYDFNRSELNPVAANYTERYYELYDETEDHYENMEQVIEGGGLINGFLPGELTGDVYGTWRSAGRVQTGYSFRNNSQFRIIASGSADIKNHAFSVGFEYEQRNDKYFGVGPIALWRQMRQLTNYHIQQLDLANPYLVYYDSQGRLIFTKDDIVPGNAIFGDTIYYDRLYDGASQSLFDYNLRKELNMDTYGGDWIDLNALPPETFSLDMFSPDELLNNGSSFVGYYGYDHTGEKLKGKPTLDDFFTKTRTIEGYNGPAVYERSVGAYEPIYVAGYIQDKFAFKDLIFNIGLRVDRFDANQQVLKDPYLLFPAISAGEVRGGGDRAKLQTSIPENIEDDYVVYVDNITNPEKILGYRDGDTWYNDAGAEVPNADPLLTGTGIQPYLLDPDKTNATEISSNAFTDYKPQVTYMPRIAFSFPISEEALFFAHYDVLSRRPSTSIDGNPIERLDPTDYFFIQNRNVTLNNPNLKPSKTVDYEFGFQQKINNYSSLKISAFYREMRDDIQITGVVNAFPTTYRTYGNIDFGTVKGLTVAYDLRRTGNVRMRTSYTLQFAEGTASSSDQALSMIASGQPNLRVINPLDFDQRHTILVTFDYRFDKGKDYNGPVWFDKQVFAKTGTNITFTTGSGTPYSKQRRATQKGAIGGGTSPTLSGMLNGSSLPWQVRMDARIDKDFVLKWDRGEKGTKIASLNVYFLILNVLNNINILSVYQYTGNPDDDGYLDAPEFQPLISSLNSEESFRDLYSIKVDNPNHYSLPRRIRLGLILGF